MEPGLCRPSWAQHVRAARGTLSPLPARPSDQAHSKSTARGTGCEPLTPPSPGPPPPTMNLQPSATRSTRGGALASPWPAAASPAPGLRSAPVALSRATGTWLRAGRPVPGHSALSWATPQLSWKRVATRRLKWQWRWHPGSRLSATITRRPRSSRSGNRRPPDAACKLGGPRGPRRAHGRSCADPGCRGATPGGGHSPGPDWTRMYLCMAPQCWGPAV